MRDKRESFPGLPTPSAPSMVASRKATHLCTRVCCVILLSTGEGFEALHQRWLLQGRGPLRVQGSSLLLQRVCGTALQVCSLTKLEYVCAGFGCTILLSD